MSPLSCATGLEDARDCWHETHSVDDAPSPESLSEGARAKV